MRTVIFLLIISLVVGCNTPKRIIKKASKWHVFNDTSTTTRIIDSTVITFDTITHVIEVSADTSYQILLIDCDSTGKASIRNSNTQQGNRSSINSTLSNNQLNIQATCKAFTDSIYALNKTIEKFKETHVSEVIKTPCPTLKLTKWQQIKIWYGGYWLAVIIGYIGFKILSLYWNIPSPLSGVMSIFKWLKK